jgi:6-phosphogluconolactonase (cycloisomerase 2 family)
MKFRFIGRVAGLGLILATLSCGNNNNSTATSGTGLLFVAEQGNSTLTSYGITLSSGGLAGINEVATGTNPSAIAVNNAVNALFVSNSAANFVTSYSIGSDGTLTVGSNTKTGQTPVALAVDPAGKFLFVANQGTFADPTSGSISVFSISGTTLTQVAGSPFLTESTGLTGSGPVSVAVPPGGNYLYVANQFTNTVSAFSYDGASGKLTAVAGSPYASCNLPNTNCVAPSAVAISPNGEFLLVANSGSNNVSSFAICAVVSTTCSTPNGTLTAVTGSPFPAGIGPGAMAFDPGFNFVYVVDQQSNQVSQYSFGPGNGVLTPLSPATISTGTTPVSISIVSGVTTQYVGNPTYNTADFVYVANIGGTSLSIYALTTSTGLLGTPEPFTTAAGQPSAVVAK